MSIKAVPYYEYIYMHIYIYAFYFMKQLQMAFYVNRRLGGAYVYRDKKCKCVKDAFIEGYDKQQQQ